MLPIEPEIQIYGAAFVGNTTLGHRPIASLKDDDELKVVDLPQWCEKNFISPDVGYRLVKKHLLIGFRRHRTWWVRANPDCLEDLLEYLGVEELTFDAE